ncbi:DUF5615 family PIN-like protein [Roseiarcus sp.]|uniref:DUF5615 family PIN-like protein n=1 Tax=Roseiarcus sp. TaxID=1969460 RepID=UPI003F99F4D2
MKLLIDMNLSPRWGRLHGSEGFEAVHWSDVGPADASDREIMDHARTHGFVVLTHDLDFGAILAATRDAKPSVVQIRADDVSPEAIGAVVTITLNRMADDLEAGALLTIDTARMRLRLLPVRPPGKEFGA